MENTSVLSRPAAFLNHSWLQARLEDGVREGCFPSAACAIGVRGLVLARAFVGQAPEPGGQSVDEHTRFDMASLSKVLGPTMIALRAMEQGFLRPEERVRDFFPGAPEDKADITVEQLMTHTGGFEPSFRLDQLLSDSSETLACILTHPLAEKPGVRPIYSCMGYILLAKMLEKRLGAPLNVLAEREVFRPLGMLETGYCPEPADAVFAATEVDPASGRPWIGVVHDENARFQGGVSGNAGVFMPLCDGIRFATMLARGGAGFLKQETLREAIRNRTPGEEEHRGLGFQIAGSPGCFFSPDVPPACFGHTGFTGTSLLVEPESGFWVLLLSNRVYPTRESTALFPFRRALHADSWRLFQASFPAVPAPEENGEAFPEGEIPPARLWQLLKLPEVIVRVFTLWDRLQLSVCDAALKARLLRRDQWDEAVIELEKRIGPDPDHLRLLWEELRIAASQWPRWRQKGLPPQVFLDTMQFADRYLTRDLNPYGRYYFSAGGWFPRQLALELFRLGSLEYELLPAPEGRRISVHIPFDASLDPPAVDDSLARFRAFVRAFFPDWQDAPLWCESWLLSPVLRRLLSPGSRILAFQDRFEITEVFHEEDTLYWVFPGCGKVSPALPEHTALQRSLKALLLSGEKPGSAAGYLR